jgi:small subunit ribosomal protein S7
MNDLRLFRKPKKAQNPNLYDINSKNKEQQIFLTKTKKNRYTFRHPSIIKNSFKEKFINLLMIDGKKGKAETLFYDTLILLREKSQTLKVHDKQSKKTKKSTLNVLLQAIENVKPSVEVRNVRVGRRTYQVPVVIKKKRQESLAIRWLLASAEKRKKKSKLTFSQSLSFEILDAYNKSGEARQKRDQIHKLAEANRAFIRYRWW